MVPVKMKAIVTAGEKKWELRKVDVPRPGPKEILVKVVAAAQNPADCEYFATCDSFNDHCGGMLTVSELLREKRLVLANRG